MMAFRSQLPQCLLKQRKYMIRLTDSDVREAIKWEEGFLKHSKNNVKKYKFTRYLIIFCLRLSMSGFVFYYNLCILNISRFDILRQCE